MHSWTPRFCRGSFSEHHHTPRFTCNPGGSMHHWRTFLAALIVVACGDQMPPSAVGGSASMLANAQSELVPAGVFNTQMRPGVEGPGCAAPSEGGAQGKGLGRGAGRAAAAHKNQGGGEGRVRGHPP